MCPVQWHAPVVLHERLPFVNVISEARVFFITSPQQHAILDLHTVDDRGRSFPCMGATDCKHHTEKPYRYAYAPVVQYDYGAKRWRHAILGLGDPSRAIAREDNRGGLCLVTRADGRDKRSCLAIKLVLPNPPDLPDLDMMAAFDVRPYLLRRWGLFKEAELIGCDLRFPDPNFVEQEPGTP